MLLLCRIEPKVGCATFYQSQAGQHVPEGLHPSIRIDVLKPKKGSHLCFSPGAMLLEQDNHQMPESNLEGIPMTKQTPFSVYISSS